MPRPLETPRLTLRPLPAAAATVLPGDRQAAADVIGARLTASWPQADLLDVLPMQAALDADQERFGVWLLIDRSTRTVIGDVGFMGPPDDGEVEIGFSVIPARRGLGYATEAVLAMVAWATEEPSIHRIRARCRDDNDPSIVVLERSGFVRVGGSEGWIGWLRDAHEGGRLAV